MGVTYDRSRWRRRGRGSGRSRRRRRGGGGGGAVYDYELAVALLASESQNDAASTISERVKYRLEVLSPLAARTSEEHLRLEVLAAMVYNRFKVSKCSCSTQKHPELE